MWGSWRVTISLMDVRNCVITSRRIRNLNSFVQHYHIPWCFRFSLSQMHPSLCKPFLVLLLCVLWHQAHVETAWSWPSVIWFRPERPLQCCVASPSLITHLPFPTSVIRGGTAHSLHLCRPCLFSWSGLWLCRGEGVLDDDSPCLSLAPCCTDELYFTAPCLSELSLRLFWNDFNTFILPATNESQF